MIIIEAIIWLCFASVIVGMVIGGIVFWCTIIVAIWTGIKEWLGGRR